jgi:hypothetical protein
LLFVSCTVFLGCDFSRVDTSRKVIRRFIRFSSHCAIL